MEVRELAPGKAAFNRLLPHVLPCSRTLGGLAPASSAHPAPARGGGSQEGGPEEDAGGRAAGIAVIKNASCPTPLHRYPLSSTADEFLST